MLWRTRNSGSTININGVQMKKAFWGMLAMMALQAGATYYASSQKGDKEDWEGIDLPDYYLDSYYGKTQADLYGMGSNILKGKPGDYFGLIGSQGGTEFEKMLADMTAGTTKRAEESAAKRGFGRGGSLNTEIASAVGKQESQLRFADLLKAIEGRKFLLSTGTDMLSGVRGAALNQSLMKNKFNLAKTGLMQKEQTAQRADEAAEDQMWSDILSSSIGAMGTYYAMKNMNTATPGSAAGPTSGNAMNARITPGNAGWDQYYNISFNQ